MSSTTAGYPTRIKHLSEEVELVIVSYVDNPTEEEVLARFKEENLGRPKAKDAFEFYHRLSDSGGDVQLVFLQEEKVSDTGNCLNNNALVIRRLNSVLSIKLDRLYPTGLGYLGYYHFVARRRKSV